jgi:branched-chain amino acid aminotransferase
MAFPGTGKIWMNGSLVDWADAKIHIASHVVHYGSGIFEGARCYDTPLGSACFRLDAHMRRLYDSARIYRMEPRQDLAAATEAVYATIRANEFKACYIRPIVYRGYAALGVNPFPCPVDTAILLWEWGAYLGQDALENGVDVRISSWARSAPNTFPTLAKTSANYANSSLIKMEAIVEGYSEGIALDTFGYLSEGSGQNLFVVRDDLLYTPPLTAAILPGITRNSVITLAREMGIRVREEMLPRELLYIADEAFFAGTAVEITPIRSVDKITIGSGRRGPVTEAIQKAFFDIIAGREPDRHGWLSYVYPGEPRTAEQAEGRAAPVAAR